MAIIKKVKDFFKKDTPKDMSNKHITKMDNNSVNDQAMPVENFSGVLEYITADIHRIIRLTSYLKNELTDIFGKHNARYRGEFFYYVWNLEFDGDTFCIFTANGKGTTFNIHANREENKSEKCINFLRKMDELLITINKDVK